MLISSNILPQAELNEEIEEMERKKDSRPKSGSRVSFRGSDGESDDDDDESGGLSGRAGSATGHRRGGGGGVSYEEFNVLVINPFIKSL